MDFFSMQYVLYAYLYIGAALLIFNLIYIYSVGLRAKRMQRKTQRWKRLLQNRFIFAAHKGNDVERRRKQLLKKLGRIRNLLAFGNALEELEKETPESLNEWLNGEGSLFNQLSVYYQRRENMEQAYVAWLLYRFRMLRPEQTGVQQILLGYLNNSTVYCRENVLKAIYVSGNVKAVESAFQYFHDYSIYHSIKLLEDGLQTFTGDKRELAEVLWRHRKNWNSDLICAIVQFITRVSPQIDMSDSFIEALADQNENMEVRLALVRYFVRYRCESARSLLQQYTLEDTTLGIVSATALAKYPGDDTIAVLQKAVCSRNWYVRSNAAVSLIALTKDHPDRERLLACQDRYGREILAYSLRKAGVTL